MDDGDVAGELMFLRAWLLDDVDVVSFLGHRSIISVCAQDFQKSTIITSDNNNNNNNNHNNAFVGTSITRAGSKLGVRLFWDSYTVLFERVPTKISSRGAI
jgi:hypothetical protein